MSLGWGSMGRSQEERLRDQAQLRQLQALGLERVRAEALKQGQQRPGVVESIREAWHRWGWWLALGLCVLIWWVVVATAWKIWPR